MLLDSFNNSILCHFIIIINNHSLYLNSLDYLAVRHFIMIIYRSLYFGVVLNFYFKMLLVSFDYLIRSYLQLNSTCLLSDLMLKTVLFNSIRTIFHFTIYCLLSIIIILDMGFRAF